MPLIGRPIVIVFRDAGLPVLILRLTGEGGIMRPSKQRVIHVDNVPPYYYGSLRTNDKPVLIVSGLEVKSHDDVMFGSGVGTGYLWLYRWAKDSRRWFLAHRERVGAPIQEGIGTFNTPGDDTLQICTFGGGVDYASMFVYGFRGTDYRPKQLLRILTPGEPQMEWHHGRFMAVDRFEIAFGLMREIVLWPLPKQLEGHLCAMRLYAYSARQDRYVLKGIEPDIETERRMSKDTIRESRDLLKEVLSNKKRASQSK
jgi:hypothetical protein